MLSKKTLKCINLCEEKAVSWIMVRISSKPHRGAHWRDCTYVIHNALITGPQEGFSTKESVCYQAGLQRHLTSLPKCRAFQLQQCS